MNLIEAFEQVTGTSADLPRRVTTHAEDIARDRAEDKAELLADERAWATDAEMDRAAERWFA